MCLIVWFHWFNDFVGEHWLATFWVTMLSTRNHNRKHMDLWFFPTGTPVTDKDGLLWKYVQVEIYKSAISIKVFPAVTSLIQSATGPPDAGIHPSDYSTSMFPHNHPCIVCCLQLVTSSSLKISLASVYLDSHVCPLLRSPWHRLGFVNKDPAVILCSKSSPETLNVI